MSIHNHMWNPVYTPTDSQHELGNRILCFTFAAHTRTYCSVRTASPSQSSPNFIAPATYIVCKTTPNYTHLKPSLRTYRLFCDSLRKIHRKVSTHQARTGVCSSCDSYDHFLLKRIVYSIIHSWISTKYVWIFNWLGHSIGGALVDDSSLMVLLLWLFYCVRLAARSRLRIEISKLIQINMSITTNLFAFFIPQVPILDKQNAIHKPMVQWWPTLQRLWSCCTHRHYVAPHRLANGERAPHGLGVHYLMDFSLWKRIR